MHAVRAVRVPKQSMPVARSPLLEPLLAERVDWAGTVLTALDLWRANAAWQVAKQLD